MTQDPEHDEEQVSSEDTLDISHDLDMVPVFSSTSVDSEVEGDLICGVLANTGIPAILSRSPFPNTGVSVRVPRESLEEAQRLIAEAQAAGPEAAAEAERASEDEH
jgi:GMP synthase PP-ATPase subunit